MSGLIKDMQVPAADLGQDRRELLWVGPGDLGNLLGSSLASGIIGSSCTHESRQSITNQGGLQVAGPRTFQEGQELLQPTGLASASAHPSGSRTGWHSPPAVH